MYNSLPDIEDLRNDIRNLKKQLTATQTENTLLKVKVRRMQEDLLRKNKQMQALLDPKMYNNRKVIAEQGASVIINLKDEVESLKKVLITRDFHIKKLQNTLLASKVYDKHILSVKFSADNTERKSSLKRNDEIPTLYKDISELGSIQPDDSNPALTQLHDNLNKIKKLNSQHELTDGGDNLTGGEKTPNTAEIERIINSPQSDVERTELFITAETPHEEMRQITSHLLNMTLEVENLKTNLMQMKRSKLQKKRSKSADNKMKLNDKQTSTTNTALLINVKPKEFCGKLNLNLNRNKSRKSVRQKSAKKSNKEKKIIQNQNIEDDSDEISDIIYL